MEMLFCNRWRKKLQGDNCVDKLRFGAVWDKNLLPLGQGGSENGPRDVAPWISSKGEGMECPSVYPASEDDTHLCGIHTIGNMDSRQKRH